MKILSTFILLLAATVVVNAQNSEAYQYKVDLNDVVDDALTVDLLVPTSIKDNPVYYFPKTVPDTYEILNYGRFVSSLKAFDRKGKEVKVERKDENTWQITGKKITRITYKIDDTWDADTRQVVFEAAGSNFEAKKNFILNANACFGFFEGQEELPFELSFDRPANFYASTSLKRTGGDFDTDNFKAQNYHELVDAPIMYNVPDTMNFKLGYGDIQISIYSPNGVVTAKDIAERVKLMLVAQSQYLGNILPVDTDMPLLFIYLQMGILLVL